jgi:DNA-3-methyladenine glycosylase I
MNLARCPWPRSDLDIAYHDTEWGVPVRDDARWFEHLFLDTMQAGLSWSLILRKRENFRRAFSGFDPRKIVRYDDAKIARLLADPGIVRNRLKVCAAITNARAFLAVQREFGTFDRYIWQFTGGRPRQNAWTDQAAVPTRTAESDALSADLVARGFKFVGSTICYAFMQATGLVNDHLVTCFRHAAIKSLATPRR